MVYFLTRKVKQISEDFIGSQLVLVLLVFPQIEAKYNISMGHWLETFSFLHKSEGEILDD